MIKEIVIDIGFMVCGMMLRSIVQSFLNRTKSKEEFHPWAKK